MLQSYMGGVISPACPGSVSGCPPGWTHVILLPREMYRTHPDQMPELFKMTPLVAKRHQLYFDLLLIRLLSSASE